jgi:DNA-binding HxlR family transcriptional regulator
MGGAPGGIIDRSCASVGASYGGSTGAIRVISSSGSVFRKQKHSRVRTVSEIGTSVAGPGTVPGMARPRPGTPVRGSATGRPVMAALDLLGRRWALRILWELRDGPVGARALRDRCDAMSSSVLYERLGELVDARLVERLDDGTYQLTRLGADLGTALAPLDEWSRRWARRVS